MTGSIGKTTRDPAMPAEREEADRLYHAVVAARADEQPSLLLDQRILAAAHAEVARAGATKRAGPPWWRRYFAPASAVIVALFGLTIAWHVMDEQELAQRQQLAAVGGAVTDDAAETLLKAAPSPDLRAAPSSAPAVAKTKAGMAEENAAPEPAKESVAAYVTKPLPSQLGRTAQPKAIAPAATVAETHKGRVAQDNALPSPQPDEAVKAPTRVAIEAPVEERASGEPPVARSAATPAPAPAPAPMLQAAPAPRLTEIPDRQDMAASGAIAPAAVPPPQLAKKADSGGGQGTMPEVEHRAAPVVELFTSADDGLRQIRAARDGGRRDEAIRLLTRWHTQYPQRTIPADLVDLLPASRVLE